MAPPKRQQVEDMPPVGEAVPLARALLELLPSMGANALVAHRALRMLAAAGAPGPALPAAACNAAVLMPHADLPAACFSCCA